MHGTHMTGNEPQHLQKLQTHPKTKNVDMIDYETISTHVQTVKYYNMMGLFLFSVCAGLWKNNVVHHTTSHQQRGIVRK